MAKKNLKKQSKKATQDRNYWNEEELEVLRSYRDEWRQLKSGKARSSLVLGTVATEIQALCPEKFGVDAISGDNNLKEQWAKRCKVSLPYVHLRKFRQTHIGRRWNDGSTTIESRM